MLDLGHTGNLKDYLQRELKAVSSSICELDTNYFESSRDPCSRLSWQLAGSVAPIGRL